MTDEQMEEQRKAKKRARQLRRRRAKGSKPREIYLANSLTKDKPWEADGVSRATWFRRRSQRETGPCPIKLTNNRHTLVSSVELESQKRGLPMKEEGDKKKRARA
jgi:hypothetical protein